jgi:hypothetical protein
MATFIFPSSYRCDCGHESDFFENTVKEMEKESKKKRTTMHLADSEDDEHVIEFKQGKAVTVICPKLGKCKITKEE